MKKFIAIIVALILSVTLCIAPKAHADVLTLNQIASAAYAYGQAAGINFGFTGGTTTGAQTWMENRINSWLAGRTIAEAFGSEILRVSAGRLVIPATLAMNIASFLRDLITDEGISIDNPVEVSPGSYEGIPLSNNMTSFVYEIPQTGIAMYRISPLTEIWPEIGSSSGSYGSSFLYVDGASQQQFGNSGKYFSFHYWNLTQVNNNIRCNYVTSTSTSADGERVYKTQYKEFTPKESITDKLVIGLNENYGYPEYPDIGYQWEGTINGAAPDTNLDQLMDIINTDIADNNLDIEGEVVNPIDPPPTPIPTVEPGDIDGYWNRQADQLEGLGNDIGDISGHLDDLGQQAEDITDAIEGVNQGIQTQTGVISGALDQASQDIVDAIGEQTGVLDESLTTTAEGVQEIAEALTSPQIVEKTFDLRELFPFCIPFDIYHLLQKFDGSPSAPHVQLPIVIPSIGFSYIMDLDFSAWDPVAAAMRTVELIVYALGLAWATSKVIKW